ncbi:NAD(P)/FAD-dependent oxidoreductase, partial [Aestuariivita boseongensis]|uniref:NAD(P)/FAD-dependent oxidoreductase n=1 Tax=Aestuariivita boseongensis TaxID=1470562 RepID=UPI0006822ABF
PAGPGAGASGGLVGALAPHVPENWNDKKAFQFESLLLAEPFWAGVEAAGGTSSGYGRTGRLQPIADDHALALARAREETARGLWQGRADWRVIDAGAAGDWAPHSPTGLLIHDTLSARMHPRRACAALVAALATKGVTVAADGPDTGPTIWCTGVAGLEALNAGHHRSVGNGVKGQAALLAPAAPLPADAPQLFADALHIIPHADGTIAVGSTSERDYDDPTCTDTQLDDVIARAHAQVPALRDAKVVDRWAGLRPRARSRAPMAGPWPGRPDAYIANGGFKIGFGMAPKLAEIMADLVLEGRDAIPDAFRVEASL